MKKPEMIILTGDMVFDADFRDVLEEAMRDYLGWVPLSSQRTQWSSLQGHGGA